MYIAYKILPSRPIRLQVVQSKTGQQELWLLTSAFQKFMTGSLNTNETNFHIQAGYVDELIRGTKCSGSRPFTQNRGYGSFQFPKWRLWDRKESEYPHLQTLPSVQYHRYPDSFAELRTLQHLSRFFIRSLAFPFHWVIRSFCGLEPANYTVFVNHDWGTRNTTCILTPLVNGRKSPFNQHFQTCFFPCVHFSWNSACRSIWGC